MSRKLEGKRAVGYIRVSTQMQVEDGQSLEAQKNMILKFCIDNKMDFVKIYDDKGLSAKDYAKRPGLLLLLEELEPETVIITYSLSRISRTMKHIYELLDKIKEKDCELYLIDQPNLDFNNANSKFMFNVMASMTEYERMMTGSRVSATMQSMSREGRLKTKPKYGWRVEEVDGKKTHVEDEAEQKVIKKIGELIENDPRITIKAIIDVLERDGVKMRKAKKIYNSVISRIILDNKLR
jgi:site-specific DNA recombinase